MKKFNSERIKNIAVFGHSSSGKTTLLDAILYFTGNTDRIGHTEDGTTVMDFDQEEKNRKISISSSAYQLEYNDNKLNFIDVPGLFDFAAGVTEALSVADFALIALSGKSGLTVGAQLNYLAAKGNGIPAGFFVGKLDSPRAYFYRVLSTLTGHYGAAICPIVVPYSEGEAVKCFVNLITNKAYTFDGIKATETEMPVSEDIANMRAVMLEAVAAVDESLMEKYFEEIEFTEDEILTALSVGIASGDICPVFAGIQQSGAGVSMLVDILNRIAPNSTNREFKVLKGESEGSINCNQTAPAAAVVFKTVADPFVGKLSYFKAVSGEINGDMKLINTRTGKDEKLGKIMYLKAGKQEETASVVAGDICCAAKLGDVKTGDTLCVPGEDLKVVTPEYSKPVLSMAVKATKKGDEEKIAQGLIRLSEEDPTISFAVNNETKQQILSGLGEQHLDVVASKLNAKFGVEIKLEIPKVAYRETIKKPVKVQGRHKKQSGGHGQFGDVWIEFAPAETVELIFEEKVFGGAVPKNFFPAVEKGLRESCVKGVLAGYPVVGLKATLVDGSYHPVDSSEMSFKMAANIAFKTGIPQASPVLLEPIGTLKVVIPEDNMGDVIGDINKRRGRVLGMTPLADKKQEILAEVPMAEMGDFATAMRSIAQGWATFEFNFERYEEAPSFVSQKIIENYKED